MWNAFNNIWKRRKKGTLRWKGIWVKNRFGFFSFFVVCPSISTNALSLVWRLFCHIYISTHILPTNIRTNDKMRWEVFSQTEFHTAASRIIEKWRERTRTENHFVVFVFFVYSWREIKELCYFDGKHWRLMVYHQLIFPCCIFPHVLLLNFLTSFAIFFSVCQIPLNECEIDKVQREPATNSHVRSFSDVVKSILWQCQENIPSLFVAVRFYRNNHDKKEMLALHACRRFWTKKIAWRDS